jgi:hypothetical protein
MLGIYEIGAAALPWDMLRMAARDGKKESAQKSALAIAAKLARLEHQFPSEAQWCKHAGVSSSFFSNLRGTPTKPPSDPSVDSLRSVLRSVNFTLPEMFADEARDRLVPAPTEQAIEQALRDALPDMPRSPERRAEYLASVVLTLLGLPQGRPATEATEPESERVEDAPPRVATK